MAKEIATTDKGRVVRAINEKGVVFPAPPASSVMPECYGEILRHMYNEVVVYTPPNLVVRIIKTAKIRL